MGGGKQSAGSLREAVNAVAVGFCEENNVPQGVAGLVFVRSVGVGQPGDLRVVRPEGGFRHAEGIKEALLQEVLVGHAADDFNDARGDVDILVAVLILVTRLPLLEPGARLPELRARSLSGSAIRCRVSHAAIRIARSDRWCGSIDSGS